MGSVIEAMRIRISDGDEIFLMELVNTNVTFGATDPRDKIYGSLGLEKGQHATRLVPNYAATVPEVYQQATEALLEQGLVLLSYAGLCYGRGPSSVAGQLPSWVPDFSQPRPVSTISSTWGFREGVQWPDVPEKCWKKFSEVKEAEKTYIISPDGSRQTDEAMNRVLLVPGWQVHTIGGVGPESFKFGGVDDYDGTQKEALANYLVQCLQLVEDICRRFPRAETPASICANTLLASTTSGPPLPAALRATVKTLRKSGTRVTRNYISIPDNKLADQAMAFMGRLDHTGIPHFRKLCWTEDGRIGLAPDIVKKGDLVVVLGDMTVPLILRICPESIHSDKGTPTKLYQLIGEIYIDGFGANGISDILKDNSQRQYFALL